MIKNVYKGCAFTGGNSSYSDNAYLDFLFIILTENVIELYLLYTLIISPHHGARRHPLVLRD
ncbi:hypothetical protein FYL84_22050, partial [Salmonella enterica subsp. enterica serovar Typhimurium]